MSRLNRKVEYALIALKYMSSRFAGQLTTAKEICAATGAPFDATSRALQLLCQSGILRAEQGAHGGYLLVRDLQKVSLLEVLEAITGPTEIVRCVRGEEDCELFTKCNIVSPLQSLNLKLENFYRDLSIAELLSGKEALHREWQAEAQ